MIILKYSLESNLHIDRQRQRAPLLRNGRIHITERGRELHGPRDTRAGCIRGEEREEEEEERSKDGSAKKAYVKVK